MIAQKYPSSKSWEDTKWMRYFQLYVSDLSDEVNLKWILHETQKSSRLGLFNLYYRWLVNMNRCLTFAACFI